MRVLITRQIPESGPALLRQAGFDVTMLPNERPLSPADLLAAADGMDGLVCMLTDRITAEFLDARPSIRAVANVAVGFNNIDVPACTARKIGASNTPGVLNNATAETAFLLMLTAARRASEGEHLVRSGQWNGMGFMSLLGVDTVGATLGIIGAGRIGARVAKMATGFDMKLLYHNRTRSTEMDALGATLVSKEQLLRESDFVSLHTPLTPETRHLIGPAEFAMMKPTAVLVNTSRGPVVDEAALVEALQSKKIFAAGLDVYEEEPKLYPGLRELPNVFLLPHIGSATVSTRSKMAALAAENMLTMLAGNRPPNALNPEVWG